MGLFNGFNHVQLRVGAVLLKFLWCLTYILVMISERVNKNREPI